MRPVLILTDDPTGGQRLARNLGGGATVHDLYDDAPMPLDAPLIVADLSSPDSGSIRRLQKALGIARAPTTPLLYLIHGSVERGEIQATMLGATRSLPASTAIAFLMNAVANLIPTEPPPARPDPAVQVEDARRVFNSLFSKEAPSLQLVDEGTHLVDDAVRDMKVRDWLNRVAQFDDVTHRHCLSVAGLAAAFAHSLGLNAADSHLLTKGALLHDIGKANVPLAILNKPGPLNADERRAMNRHPVYGFDMLQGRSYSPITLSVVRSHHEMLDGSGYPDGLKGRQIPDLVRLITICDIFAALIERRPYKMPKSAQSAYQILTEMRGRLDQDLVRAFASVAFAVGEDDSLAACG